MISSLQSPSLHTVTAKAYNLVITISMATLALFLCIIAVATRSPVVAAVAGVTYEYGYTVSTVFEGDKVEASSHINPFSALPLPGGDRILLLDSANNGFYTLSLPISQESKIDRFAGGVRGFSDGEAVSAMFDNPRSFAVDARGNVYVADQNNHAIRKISASGVTTIAGGYAAKAGGGYAAKAGYDGPGQNATFSNGFDLTYIHQMCALLISDHSNRRIRQMNLKADDCLRKTPPLELGMTWTLVIGAFCLLVGVATGFAVRPYVIISRNFPRAYHLSKTWNQCLTQVEKRVQIFFYGIRSAVVSIAPYFVMTSLLESTLSYLCLVFRFYFLKDRPLETKNVSLLDLDSSNTASIEKPQITAKYLKDLISLDDAKANESDKSNLGVAEVFDACDEKETKIDAMIQASITGFDSSFRKSVFRRSQVNIQ